MNIMISPKRLTAQALLEFLKKIEKDGHDLSLVVVNFSYDRDYGIAPIRHVFEYEYSSNDILKSIVIMSKL